MVSPLRLKYPGAIYHVMARGHDGDPIVRSDTDRLAWYEALEHHRALAAVDIFAHALLDNHFHLLLETIRGNLSEFMRNFGSSYVTGFKKRHKHRGSLFQNRFKSILVEEESYLLTLVRYIHRQPVEAGIETRAEVYRWTSFGEYLGVRPPLVTLARGKIEDLFDRDFKKEFRAYHSEEMEPSPPESSLARDVAFYGGTGFKKSIERNIERRRKPRLPEDCIPLARLDEMLSRSIGGDVGDLMKRGKHAEAAERYAIIRLAREIAGASYQEMADQWNLTPGRLAQHFARHQANEMPARFAKAKEEILRSLGKA